MPCVYGSPNTYIHKCRKCGVEFQSSGMSVPRPNYCYECGSKDISEKLWDEKSLECDIHLGSLSLHSTNGHGNEETTFIYNTYSVKHETVFASEEGNNRQKDEIKVPESIKTVDELIKFLQNERPLWCLNYYISNFTPPTPPKIEPYVVTVTDKHNVVIPNCDVYIGESNNVVVDLSDAANPTKEKRVIVTVTDHNGEPKKDVTVVVVGVENYQEEGKTYSTGRIAFPTYKINKDAEFKPERNFNAIVYGSPAFKYTCQKCGEEFTTYSGGNSPLCYECIRKINRRNFLLKFGISLLIALLIILLVLFLL